MIAQYIIVEGQFEKFLLERVLPKEIVSHSKFIIGSGYHTALSKARSILVASELPVSIVVDAETTDSSSIEEKQEFMAQLLGQLSSSEHFHIFVAIPELEILFFYDKEEFEKLIGETLSSHQWELAHYQPKEVLQEIFRTNNLQDTLQEELTSEMIAYLSDTDLIQAMIKSFPVNGGTQSLFNNMTHHIVAADPAPAF